MVAIDAAKYDGPRNAISNTCSRDQESGCFYNATSETAARRNARIDANAHSFLTPADLATAEVAAAALVVDVCCDMRAEAEVEATGAVADEIVETVLVVLTQETLEAVNEERSTMSLH